MRDAVRAGPSGRADGRLRADDGRVHEGHLSLVDAAQAECDVAVVVDLRESDAVWPEGRSQPLSAQSGRATCGCWASAAAIWCSRRASKRCIRPATRRRVDVGPLGRELEGAYRPDHFRGVATVVLKLFQIVPANVAFFGRKDYQQTLVVRQMVADLNVPIEIRVVSDGPRARTVWR